MQEKTSQPSSILYVDGLTLDLDARQVANGRASQALTPKECRLLATFMRNPNQTLSYAQLMRLVWDTDYVGDIRTLYVHVCWLRRKIEDDPQHPTRLRTVPGVGYRFLSR